jgi:hypothetical protein
MVNPHPSPTIPQTFPSTSPPNKSLNYKNNINNKTIRGKHYYYGIRRKEEVDLYDEDTSEF